LRRGKDRSTHCARSAHPIQIQIHNSATPGGRFGLAFHGPVVAASDGRNNLLRNSKGGSEGSHDLVDARLELGDRERFLEKWKRGGVLTHRLVMIDA
jgi:hypothetical protein